MMLRDGDAGRRLAPTFAGIRVVFHPRTQSLPQGVSNVVSNVVSNLVSRVVSNLIPNVMPNWVSNGPTSVVLAFSGMLYSPLKE